MALFFMVSCLKDELPIDDTVDYLEFDSDLSWEYPGGHDDLYVNNVPWHMGGLFGDWQIKDFNSQLESRGASVGDTLILKSNVQGSRMMKATVLKADNGQFIGKVFWTKSKWRLWRHNRLIIELIKQDRSDDPMMYVEMFIDDAKEYGFDFSKVDGSVTVRSDIWYSGASLNSCDDGFRLEIQEHFWNNANDLKKKYVIYHELGHALLNLGHVCNLTGNTGIKYVQTEVDMMFTGAECVSKLAGWQKYAPQYAYTHEDRFDIAKERMFSMTDQNSLNCSSSKGVKNYECIIE